MRSQQRRSRREQTAALNATDWFVPKPDDRLSAAEVQAAIESLPAELREVVVLRLWSQLTLAEIAAVTDAAVSTVHAHYAEAIEMLRQKLE
jgi:RNA polymerase sigma-70 factor (ECF subfamily)